MDEKEEWDGPWKDALDSPDLVFALFWPDVSREVDLSKGWSSLEQELQKLTADSSTGLLRVDKLFEVVVAGSGDPRLVHFEAQMQADKDLPLRMFRCGYRGRDHGTSPSAASPSSATTMTDGSRQNTPRACSAVSRRPASAP